MMTRLYRFFNIQNDAYGEPFALCDKCRPSQRVPPTCILYLIADGAREQCAICGCAPKRALELIRQ